MYYNTGEMVAGKTGKEEREGEGREKSLYLPKCIIDNKNNNGPPTTKLEDQARTLIFTFTLKWSGVVEVSLAFGNDGLLHVEDNEDLGLYFYESKYLHD